MKQISELLFQGQLFFQVTPKAAFLCSSFMIIKWVQALKKKKEKNRNHQNKLTIPISFVFFKYPQYLEEIFIWIYMKLFAHVCFFLVPPAALWQITTALLFFLNSPPLILYESSLEQPVFEGKTNRINIWTCSLNDLLDCHCCLDLSYTG